MIEIELYGIETKNTASFVFYNLRRIFSALYRQKTTNERYTKLQKQITTLHYTKYTEHTDAQINYDFD